MSRPTLVERAYELGKSGECATTAEVRRRLAAEGYDQVAKHLVRGSALYEAIRELCRIHYYKPD